MTDEQIPVNVLYDREEPIYRRRCFWEDIDDDETYSGYEFRYVSVYDGLERNENPANELFGTTSEAQALVLNWDVINTDLVYGSRENYDLLKHYIPDMNRWVRQNGNVILVENQSAGGNLLQEAYDIFAHGEYRSRDFSLTVSNETPYDDMAYVDTSSENPVVDGLPERLSLERADLYAKTWFPDTLTGDLPSIQDFETEQKRLYAGWFESWDDNWEPLVFADENHKRPVLMCRYTKKNEKHPYIGAYVVTTMYLASSNTEQVTTLIENILKLSTESEDQLQQLEQQREERRARRIKFAGVVVGGFITVVALGLGSLVFGISVNSILGAVITGAVSSFIYYAVEETLRR